MDFVQNLWQSIFTPGTTPTLIKATHASFVALELTLVAMLVATRSLHFVALLILATGLWLAISWFIAESQKYQKEASGTSLKGIDAEEIRAKAVSELREPTPPEIIDLTEASPTPEPEPRPATTGSNAAAAKPRTRRKRTV